MSQISGPLGRKAAKQQRVTVAFCHIEDDLSP